MITNTSAKPSVQKAAQKGAANRKGGSQELAPKGASHEGLQKSAANKSGKGKGRSKDLLGKGFGQQSPQKPPSQKDKRVKNPSQELAPSVEKKAAATKRKKKTFCMYHFQGVCMHTSENCAFAHDISEIRGAKKESDAGSDEALEEDRSLGNVQQCEDGKMPPAASSSGMFGFGSPLPSPTSFPSAPIEAANPFFHPSPAVGLRLEASIGATGLMFGGPSLSPPPGLEQTSVADMAGEPMYINIPRLDAPQHYPANGAHAFGDIGGGWSQPWNGGGLDTFADAHSAQEGNRAGAELMSMFQQLHSELTRLQAIERDT